MILSYWVLVTFSGAMMLNVQGVGVSKFLKPFGWIFWLVANSLDFAWPFDADGTCKKIFSQMVVSLMVPVICHGKIRKKSPTKEIQVMC